MKYVKYAFVHHTYMYDSKAYFVYFHISVFCFFIGFHIFLILPPHIAHSSGNMLLKVLQCCRFWIIMNLNRIFFLLEVKRCIADSGLRFSMEVNFGTNSP